MELYLSSTQSYFKSFLSTQGSEIDAFKQIQGFQASATPAPITTLILSPFGRVKFTCKTEADIRKLHFITGHNTFLYGSVNGPKLLEKKNYTSQKACNKL